MEVFGAVSGPMLIDESQPFRGCGAGLPLDAPLTRVRIEGAFFPPPGLVIDPDTQTRDRCFGDWPLGNWTPSYTGHISKIGSCGGVSAVADGRVRPVLERRRRVLLHGSVPDVTPMGLWADYR
jgi:hypothetical protein